MSKQNVYLYALNAGEVSYRVMARTDLAKLRLAADQQTNLIPRIMGGAAMRPGTEYLGATASNSKPQLIPFIFNSETTALLEMTPAVMRV